MKKIKKILVPTGTIYVFEHNDKHIESLSIGDYGKDVNIKARFLGLNKEPSVKHTKLLPLEKKWVMTLSTQYGCSMNCTFCDVPRIGPGINIGLNEIIAQVQYMLNAHSDVEYSERLNIHYARMGEPTFNPDVLESAIWFKENINDMFFVHPVVSTMMPKNNKWLKQFLRHWMTIKNDVYEGNAGLQLSINSTNEAERNAMFSGNTHTLENIANIMSFAKPYGRKITLNFAVANYEIDPEILLKHFDPKYYIVKLTPMHRTATAIDNNIKTAGDYTTYYPYKEYEQKLVDAGYDTLVFIASEEEDSSGITCGNAISK